MLMVDFSCALKLAMPLTVLSAIREAGGYGITVKGGKFLEAVAEADTVVFDKTGTLTKAKPTVKEVIPFGEEPEEECLRIAACLEEHFPIPWQKPWWMPRRSAGSPMRKCIPRWSISWLTGSLPILTGKSGDRKQPFCL